jgi:hypothetical protein
MSSNEAVAKLCVLSIGRVLMRSWEKNGDWSHDFCRYTRDINHVRDWLTSSVADGDPWLKRVDVEGRPLKLTKMHSMEQLVAEADKAFAKKLQKVGKSAAGEGEELFMVLSDGYKVVQMLTPSALDRESTAMQHCVGLGSYDRHLNDERYALFSLRDHLGHPHATIEVDRKNKALLQLRGKQNALPIMKYLRLLAPFITAERLNSGETASMGFVIGAGGVVHHSSEIPDGAEFDGLVSLQGYEGDPIIRLPVGIVVRGDLFLHKGFEGLLALPGTVSGDVHAKYLTLPDLSPDFKFGGGLNLEGSWVGNLPENLHIRGDLVLKHWRRVVLPRGLVIDGDLDVTQAGINELPDDIVIKGSLLASNSTLNNLPDGLSVGGSVFLGSTKHLEEIPPGFSVGDNLMLRDSSVRHIADDVFVGGMVSINADVASELTLSESAVLEGGIYFRPAGSVRAFEDRNSMTADEFRANAAPEVVPQVKIARLG